MSFVNRQLYKQKPQAWGPASAVQASIFKNAERVGIDPVLLKCVMPFWSPGNQFDYSANIFHTISGNPIFDKKSIVFDGSGDYISANSIATRLSDGRYHGALMIKIIPKSLPPSERYFLSMRRDDNSRWYMKHNASSLLVGWNTATTYSTGETLLIGQSELLTLTWNAPFVGLYRGENLVWSISDTNSLAPNNFAISALSSVPTNTNYHANQAVDIVFVFDIGLDASQIAYIADNPYFLLPRVPTVFYSVPGGAGGVTISSTTGTVVVTGYDVGIETEVTISVNTGTITGTGFNVEVEQGTSVQVTTGEISINGLNPDIVQGTQFIVTQGMVAINGFDTTVLNGTEINVTSKNISVTGYDVEVEQGIIITSSIESVVITGYNVSVTNELVISLNVGNVIIAGYNTTVLAGTRIDLIKAEITITGLDLEIEQGTQIDVTSETVTIIGLDVSVENALSINVTTGSINVLGYPVSVYAGILVEATTGNVAITGYNPTVAQSSGIEVTTGQVTITGLDTTIECTVLIEPTTGMVIIASYEVTVTDSLVAETPITRTNVVAASNRVITNSGSSRLIVIT